MSTPDLWEEAHSDSMEQADCYHLYQQMTPEQRVTAAACLQRWSDGFYEFSPQGQGCIPDPRETELDRVRKLLAEEKSAREKDAQIYREHIASRRQVHVSIRNGYVEVERIR